jgi:prepilin-type N-terminal cleavage/methylation domain-containing protein
MRNLKLSHGLTLIEIIIAVAVFVLFSLAAYEGYTAVYAAIASAHHKALAADLVNARFEIIKNLPYTNVGTVGGNPNGVIPTTENVSTDNITFVVTTTIVYVDDPFDGMSGAGDVFPNDYKLVEISVACAACNNFPPVVITGRVAPKNLESA